MTMKRIPVLLIVLLSFSRIMLAQEADKVKSISNATASRGGTTGNSIALSPSIIAYQGILTDASGNPVADGNYQVTFRTYPVASGGSTNGTFGPYTVTTVRGLFATQIEGWAIGFFQNPSSRDLWISVQVGSNPELTPRVRLTAVPYAFAADFADNARALLLPYSTTTSAAGVPAIGVTNTATTGWGIVGITAAPLTGANNFAGVRGISTAAADGVGVTGSATGTRSAGVLGFGDKVGVNGYTQLGNGTAGVFDSGSDGVTVPERSAGVVGVTESASGTGMAAINTNSGGTALEIEGGIKVTGTGARPAFVVGTGGNATVTINNALCNGNPNAIIIATPNTNSGPSANFVVPFSVFYNTATSRWIITRMDGLALPPTAQFNVLIINQ
jgi:hypothetical protein